MRASHRDTPAFKAGYRDGQQGLPRNAAGRVGVELRLYWYGHRYGRMEAATAAPVGLAGTFTEDELSAEFEPGWGWSAY